MCSAFIRILDSYLAFRRESLENESHQATVLKERILFSLSFAIVTFAAIFHMDGISWQLLIGNVIVRTMVLWIFLKIMVHCAPLIRNGSRAWKRGAYAAVQFPLLFLMFAAVR